MGCHCAGCGNGIDDLVWVIRSACFALSGVWNGISL
jgi:hypothetical protein